MRGRPRRNGSCGFEWHVDVEGRPVDMDTCGLVVSCVRDRHTGGTRHIGRHPTEVGEFVYLPLERSAALPLADDDV